MRKVIVGASEVRSEVGALLRRHGVRGRAIRCGTAVGYEYSVPSERGTMRVRSWASPPTEVSGRIARRMRRRLKKIVKNKAFKALGQVAKMAASVVPGASALVTAVDVAQKAAQAVRTVKRVKNHGLKAALPGALRAGARQLRGL